MNLHFMKIARQKQIMENLTLIFFQWFSESCFLCEGNFLNDRRFKTLSKLPNEGCFENLGWIWPKLHFFLFQAVLAHFLAPKYSLKVFTEKTKLNLFQNPILNYFPLRPKLFLKFLHEETFLPAVLCLCLCSQHTPPRTTRISGLKSKVLKWPFFA